MTGVVTTLWAIVYLVHISMPHNPSLRTRTYAQRPIQSSCLLIYTKLFGGLQHHASTSFVITTSWYYLISENVKSFTRHVVSLSDLKITQTRFLFPENFGIIKITNFFPLQALFLFYP